MPQPNVTIYGSRLCVDTQRAICFLDDHQVPYEFKDVDEEPALREYLAGLNDGHCMTPTIRVNNENLFNPSERELAEAVKVATL
jgi:glutaredoxin